MNNHRPLRDVPARARTLLPWRTRGIPHRNLTRQQNLPFLDRRDRLERRFKRAIRWITFLAALAMLAASPTGRYNVQRFLLQARWWVGRWLGLPSDRAAIEGDWRIRRQRSVELTSRTYREVYDEADPELRNLLDFGGLAPDDGFFRWGNYNLTFLFPSKIFLPDDTGRAYRMRPNTRSIWLKNVRLPRDLWGFFLMPDTDELRRVIEGTGASIVPGSTQTTNSWGCRGPEPDPSAPVRGLILGDSNMQGVLVGDDQTPPERLRRELEQRLSTRVSVLNTGHLGYSPEQFYYSLLEYGGHFQPSFVLFTYCTNDFGAVFQPIPDPRDLEDGKYWIDKIIGFCQARDILVVAAPVPHEEAVISTREEGYFPSRICSILPIDGLRYCNPFDDFADEHLRLMLQRAQRGDHSIMSPLFNGPHHDVHMSAAGTAVWGKAVGRRLALLLEQKRLNGRLEFPRSEVATDQEGSRQQRQGTLDFVSQ